MSTLQKATKLGDSWNLDTATMPSLSSEQAVDCLIAGQRPQAITNAFNCAPYVLCNVYQQHQRLL